MKNKLTTFYIVRHGQTEWNLKKLIQGYKDSPLTDLGKLQAKETANILKNIHFDKVFSSDLLRAKHTAEIIALERQMAIETTNLLREQHYGSLEGSDSSKLFALFDKWNELSDEEHMKMRSNLDAENDEETITRFITFLREVAIVYAGKTILVVTHGGVISILLVKLGYTTYKKLKDISNAGYIKVDSDGADFFVRETYGLKLNES